MDNKATGEKHVASNKKAFHDYFILEKLEAGMVLLGTEVKSIREGRINLKDSYAMIRDGEPLLVNCHISPYSHGNRENHDRLAHGSCCCTIRRSASSSAKPRKRD